MSEIIEVQGLRELQAKLKSLPAEIAQKALKKGVAAGARFVREAARGLAPQASGPIKRKSGVTFPGTLRRAAIIKFIREDSNATQIEYIVTFRQGKRAASRGADAFYARFVEFGHAKRGGGTVAPRRFLAPALSQNVDRVIEIMQQTIADELNKMPEFQ